MKQDAADIFKGLKASYTLEEAKSEIDSILRKYAPDCEIVFKTRFAEIINSYKVGDIGDRHRICAIISLTRVTDRSYEDLSAEWMVHNAAWDAHFQRGHAKDVALDYKGDPRASVRLATAVFDALDIE